MATKKSKPQFRSRRNLPPPASEGFNFESLHQLIEAERARLMDAEAVLDCMLVAMEEDVRMDGAGPSYPNVVRIVRALVNAAIDRLDSVNVKAAIAARDGMDNVCAGQSMIGKGAVGGYGGVKETVPTYVH